MILDDIADYLSSGGIGTAGTDIFKGLFPSEAPDACVAIYEAGGMEPVKTMAAGPNTSVVERPHVEVVCRAGAFDYATARTKAHAVFKLLDGLPTRTINGTLYEWASAVQSPFPLGRDQNDRPRIACIYRVVKQVHA